VDIYPPALNSYSSTGASTGQTPLQVPQDIQASVIL